MATKLDALLKKRRDELGLTQEEMAAACGVTQPLIHRWETGDCLPSLSAERVDRTAKAYRISAKRLVNLIVQAKQAA